MSSYSRQLRWIQANHGRRDSTQVAGACVERIVDRVVVTGRDAAVEAICALADIVDQRFRAHCRIVVTERRVLVVNVDDPLLVCTLRSQWLLPLRETLRGRRCGNLGGGVMFVFGREGIGFADVNRIGS